MAHLQDAKESRQKAGVRHERCILCTHEIAPSDHFACPACSRPHHQACWSSHGGCGSASCSGGKTDAISKKSVMKVAREQEERAFPIWSVLALSLVLLTVIWLWWNLPRIAGGH
jgi:hypothetical protein